MKAYPAPSLEQLLEEVNARFPKRKKASDGWIGDPKHAARVSDHNPAKNSTPPGCVRARDFTLAVKDGAWLVKRLITDSRVEYVIHDGKIWRRKNKFKAERYDGANPHRTHVHVSLRHTTTAERSVKRWLTATKPMRPKAVREAIRAVRAAKKGAHPGGIREGRLSAAERELLKIKKK